MKTRICYIMAFIMELCFMSGAFIIGAVGNGFDLITGLVLYVLLTAAFSAIGLYWVYMCLQSIYPKKK